MILARPRLLITVTFLKHFALEVWVSIVTYASSEGSCATGYLTCEFCQRGSNSTLKTVFKVDKGERGSENHLKRMPLLVRQRNAIEMTFRWRAGGGPSWNASLVAL